MEERWINLVKNSKYVNDQAFGRSFGIKLYNSIFYKANVDRSKKMVIGRDKWIFNNNERNINQYKGQKNYSKQVIEDFVATIKTHQKVFEGQYNIPFLFFIAPDKHYIYPEHLPPYMDVFEGAYNNLDRCERVITQQQINYIEIPNKLRSLKTNSPILYQKASAHWNSQGAFEAYQELMKAIKIQFPSITVLKKEDCTIINEKRKQDYHYSLNGLTEDTQVEIEHRLVPASITKEVFRVDGNLISPMDSTKVAIKRLAELITTIIETEQKDAPTLVLIRDSFGNELIPFLEHSFSKIILIHHYFGKWNPAILDQINPDIVVLEVAQRNIEKMLNTPDFTTKKAKKSLFKKK